MYLYAIPWTGNYPVLDVYKCGDTIRIGWVNGYFVGYSSKTNLVYIESEYSPDEVYGFNEFFIKKIDRVI